MIQKTQKNLTVILWLGGAAVCWAVLYIIIGQWVGLDANWDLRNYHWYNAHALWQGRLGVDLLPAQTPSFFNPLLDLALYALFTEFSPRVASAILAFVQSLNGALLMALSYVLCAPLAKAPRLAISIAMGGMGLLGAGTLAQIGTSFYDNITSLGVWLALLLLLCRWQWLFSAALPRAMAWAALAGLCVGLVSGIKLPTTVFAVGVCFALLLGVTQWPRRFMLSFAVGLGVLLGFALTYAPWGWYLWENYHNPFFPYFNNVFQSSLTAINSARDVNFIPHGWEYLTFPWLIWQDSFHAGEIQFKEPRLLLLVLALPAGFISLLWRDASPPANTPNATAYIFAFAALSYVCWLLMFAIYRYVLPLEMLAPLILFLVLWRLPFLPWHKFALLLLLCTGMLAATKPADWGRAPAWPTEGYVGVRGLDLPDNAMLLMAGFEPYSHIVTALPQTIAAVRFQSNFASPDQSEKGINQIVHARIGAHQGPFYLLYPLYDDYQIAIGLRLLNAHLPRPFSLPPKSNCGTVQDNFGYVFWLCPLKQGANHD